MSQEPIRSPWPRRLLVGFAALVALDAAVLAAAVSTPAVREQASRFAPAFGTFVTAATSQALSYLPSTPVTRWADAELPALGQLSPMAALAPIDAIDVADFESTDYASYSFSCSDDSPEFTYAYGEGRERGFRYLYAERSKDGDGWTMSGSFNEDRMSYLRKERGAFVWFGDDDAEYVVRDPKLVARAGEVSLPVRQMGSEMGRIGGQMGRIGGQMGRIGGRQGAIGARMGALAALGATAAMAGDDAQAERIDAETEKARRQLERQSRQLELEMKPLAAEQKRLGRIQEELGRKQQRLVETERQQMRELFEQAKREGKAVRLHAEA